MIYIIEGEEELFIKNKINEICNVEDTEIIKFDGNSKDFSIQNMLDSCMGNSLFAQKSIVLVKDAPFLTKKYEDKELKALLEYVENPLYEIDLVFYSFENKLNGKLKAYKTISKNAQKFELNSYDYKNFNTLVNQYVNRYKLNINNDAIYLLNTICKRNATLLNQNIQVLLNYPDKITVDVINKLCTASDDNNSFEMINALTAKDISKAISLERRMLKENDSVISIIGLLASQLRFLYQLSYYNSIGMKKDEIIDITKCSETRYKMSLDTLRKLKLDQIIELLNALSDLDIKCKTDNSVSDTSRFELFILDLLKAGNYASN